nr:hypothetical protein CFP56_33671 [Quercus suber]
MFGPAFVPSFPSPSEICANLMVRIPGEGAETFGVLDTQESRSTACRSSPLPGYTKSTEAIHGQLLVSTASDDYHPMGAADCTLSCRSMSAQVSRSNQHLKNSKESTCQSHVIAVRSCIQQIASHGYQQLDKPHLDDILTAQAR